MTLNVAVIYGSRSVEHDVSVITALQVMGWLDRSKYQVLPVFITRTGAWVSDPNLFTGDIRRDIERHRELDANPKGHLVTLPAEPGTGGFLSSRRGPFGGRRLLPCDVVIPALHGTHGEDGSIQGLLELADMPYVGSRLVSSAIAIDKIVTKRVLVAGNFDVAPWVATDRSTWAAGRAGFLKDISSELTFPLFVKPACLGSSIGITRVDAVVGLSDAIDLALRFGDRVLVEAAVVGAIDINCSVRRSKTVEASVCEQPIGAAAFLNFADKYLGSPAKGMKGARSLIPAGISEELAAKVRSLAISVFKAFDCRGLARIDFLVRAETGEVFVNEVNTLPGSYALYLWQATGVSPAAVLDDLIQDGLAAAEAKRTTTFGFESGILDGRGGSKVGSQPQK